MSTTTATTHVWRPSSARRLVLDGFVPVPRGTLPAPPAALAWPAKDPSDVLDYAFDISAALAGNEGDAIASVDVAVTPGDLVVGSVAADGARVVLWLSGGQAGVVYSVQMTMATLSGRTVARTVLLPVLALAQAAVPALALTTQEGAAITDENGNPILVGS
ncbi:phage fiber-tail adaptor protein [Limobrevibacterium gyesilva]|uniref:Uncharacterized protein n=1 Tax=Limobrevibacterium gyesilva TaxID=2991712 RepID=A0AA42CGW9_9PROT|nr:hypothetical protein [Limobrevibacterium gyesilva]MCW3476551.1 hypothetical protein [Limobrevibacterium gyesilva]